MNQNPYANTNVPLSPEEAYLASRLFGKSLFSAIQLSKERERAENQAMGAGGDVLRIPIPRELVPGMGKESAEKTADDLNNSPGIIGRALRFNRNPIRTLVGGDAGFSEGKREYFEMERQQIQRELEHAQREYLRTLQQIKHASETPMLDSFVNGLASELTLGEGLDKVSENTAETAEISDGALKRVLGDLLGQAKKPIQPALDLGATGLASTAAGTAYFTYMLKKKLREGGGALPEPELPTRIELQPYNV